MQRYTDDISPDAIRELLEPALETPLDEMSPPEVLGLQRALARRGHPLGIDGIVGPITRAALRAEVGRMGLFSVYAGYLTAPIVNALASPAEPPQAGRSRTHAPEVAVVMALCATHCPAVLGAERYGPALDVLRAVAAVVIDVVGAENLTPDAAVAVAMRALYEYEPHEEWGKNQGGVINVVSAWGGRSLTSNSPYCAYGVTGMRMLVQAIYEHYGREDVMPALVESGRAAELWSLVPRPCRVRRDDLRLVEVDAADGWGASHRLVGASVSRTRTSDPQPNIHRLLAGQRVSGHVAVVVEVHDLGDGRIGLLCLAFNSSGSGHSRSSAGGRLAFEYWAPKPTTGKVSRSEGHAHKAWARMAGAAFTAPLPEGSPVLPAVV